MKDLPTGLMIPTIVIVFVLVFLFFGCDTRYFSDEPFVVISKPMDSGKKDYKYLYKAQAVDTDVLNTKMNTCIYYYSNDSLKIGTNLYLKVEK